MLSQSIVTLNLGILIFTSLPNDMSIFSSICLCTRISFRWMALPSCLHLNLWHSAVDNTNTRTGAQLTNRSRHIKYLILFFIAFVFVIVLFVTMDVKRHHSRTRRRSVVVATEHGEDSNFHYGIVVDCGSSGSRVFIYYWPQHNGNPDDLLKIKQMRSLDGNPLRMKIKPGENLLL